MSYKNSIRRLFSRCLHAAAVVTLAAGLAPALAQAGQSAGAVYVMSNQTSGNSVLVYNRAADGTLTYSTEVPTGGTGFGTGGDPLVSQGALVYANGLLFAVNPGSNDVSMFAANANSDVCSIRFSAAPRVPSRYSTRTA